MYPPTPCCPVGTPTDFAPWSQALTAVSLQGPRSPLDMASSRSSDAARPVGQVDRHIQLLVHGVGQAGKDCRGWGRECPDEVPESFSWSLPTPGHATLWASL